MPLRLSLAAFAVAVAIARPALASPYSSPVWAAAESPEALLDKAQRAFDDGRFAEAAELAASAYAALPLKARASLYGENAVFQATNAYREAWLAQGDEAALVAARDLLQRHVDDYDERSKGKAPGNVTQELRRFDLLLERCRQPDPQLEPVAATVEPEPAPRPAEAPATLRPVRRAAGAALGATATLSLGAGLLSAFVFGYGPANDQPDADLVQRRSVGHLLPAIPLGIAGGIVGGLATHALTDAGQIEKRERVGIALTVAGSVGVLAGSILLGAGAAYWPSPGTDRDTMIGRANLSVDLQSIGLAGALASLGVLGPGIGVLATGARDRGSR